MGGPPRRPPLQLVSEPQWGVEGGRLGSVLGQPSQPLGPWGQQLLPAPAMLPSALAWHCGSPAATLLSLPAAPGFGNLGKSFLIENLLRSGGAPQQRAPHSLPAAPVPLKLCPASAEQVSPPGGAFPSRSWPFPALNSSAADSREGTFPAAAASGEQPAPFQSLRPSSLLPTAPFAPPHGSSGLQQGAV